MFPNATKIMTLLGFEVKIDPSWLVIAALITWSLGQRVFPALHPGLPAEIYVAMALIAMVLFFASLILHELSHAVVARRYGLKIEGITLFIFGGVAELGKEPATPGEEFWIAVAGPVMSVSLAGVLFVVSGLTSGAIAAVIWYLASINLILGLFNLLPAFPLDGGRILRAYLWSRSGDLLSATAKACRAGEILAFALIAFGLLSLFSGSTVGGLWQILIGGFLLFAARATYQARLFEEGLQGETVASLMSSDVVTVEADTTLSELVNQIMLKHRVSFVPVVEGTTVLGFLDNEILSKIDRENWPTTWVGDVYRQVDRANSVSPKMTASDFMARVVESKRRKFLVMEGDTLLGVITVSDIMNYLTLLQELRDGHPIGQIRAIR